MLQTGQRRSDLGAAKAGRCFHRGDDSVPHRHLRDGRSAFAAKHLPRLLGSVEGGVRASAAVHPNERLAVRGAVRVREITIVVLVKVL